MAATIKEINCRHCTRPTYITIFSDGTITFEDKHVTIPYINHLDIPCIAVFCSEVCKKLFVEKHGDL